MEREQERGCGGELDFEDATIDNFEVPAWVTEALQQLSALGAQIITETALVAETDGQAIAYRAPGGASRKPIRSIESMRVHS